MNIRRMLRIGAAGFLWVGAILPMSSCHSDGTNNNNNNNNNNDKTTMITIDPSVTHQQMIGFGGSLAWYSDRIATSSKSTSIEKLLFSDLGTDIVRIKTWYYPDNYPAYTGTDNMSDDGSADSWKNSYSIYQAAKQYNPNLKVILTSWGPPANLKSNGSTREGSLKKGPNGYMYNAFAQYWVDMLDHLQYTPDYLSIQNEPTYTNPGWTTSQWSATETATLPGYAQAFDSVYQKIKDRPNAPKMLGIESANIADVTYTAFADALKDKPYLAAYGYHAYNFNGSATQDVINSTLKSKVGAYTNKPNIMTEYGDNLDWFNTALFINSTLTEANTAGYLYWKFVWDKSSTNDVAMISIDASGNYTVTPYYYLIKHFAKYIDPGYTRVDVSTDNTSTGNYLKMSAFINPANNQMTLIVINTYSASLSVKFSVNGYTVSKIIAQQSVKNSTMYKDLGDNTGNAISLPASSITTVVLDVTK